MTPIRGIVSDFGGVLTTPLLDAFAAVQHQAGITAESIGLALARVTEEDGRVNPLYEMECGRLAEGEFIAKLQRGLAAELGSEVELHEFSAIYWAALHPNQPMIDLMARLRDRGLRMALLTNNVREWEPRWRGMLPVDDIFELVVDSAFVGLRKPDPAIYELTIERFGLPPAECLFVDDIDLNCEAARAAGLPAVHFQSNDQAIAEIEQLVGGE